MPNSTANAIAEPSSLTRYHRDEVPLNATGYTTDHPGIIIVLLDQSTSMNELLSNGKTKADYASDAVNKIGFELASKCRNGGVWENKVFLNVIGYGTDEVRRPARQGSPMQSIYVGEQTRLDQLCVGWADHNSEDQSAPASQNPNDWGFGRRFYSVAGPVEHVKPYGLGDTPMAEAFEEAARQIELCFNACPKLQFGFPPTIINITDGMPDDYKDSDASLMRGRFTRRAAENLLRLESAMGNAVLFNVFLDAKNTEEHVFEDQAGVQALQNEYAQFLFDISSPLPGFIREKLKPGGESKPGDPYHHVTEESRGIIITQSPGVLVSMLRWGSFGPR